MNEGVSTVQVLFGMSAVWVAAVLFVGAYVTIVTEKVNRAIVALIGAGLMILSGVLTQEEAIAGVDFNTLGLLLGMMLIVNITQKCGVFQFVAIWSAKKVKAQPWGILLMMATVTAVFSALLDNVTTVLLTVPVTLLIAEELEIKPYPLLFAQIFASNIGGTATLIGDPPNIMIGSAVNLSFNDFVLNLAPLIVVVLLVTFIPVYFIWGRSMGASDEARARVMNFREAEAITNTRLLKQSLTVITLVISGFILQRQLHLEPASIALSGAALLLLLENFGQGADEQTRSVHHTISQAEWVTLFFFLGLFILVTGIEKVGLIHLLANELLSATGTNLNVMAVTVLWASAIFSALIDNIPFVATMIPLIKAMAPSFGGEQAIMPLWWALSLGACLGGNGTLIGASANLVVAGLSERAGTPFRFMEYTRIAFPLMLISIILSHIYIYFRYL